jgi:precorrin-2 dehydrogenase / sirohydrochlorin ferrochelatase
MSARPVLFPLFLKLEGRVCLVVGGGPEVAGKIPGLLASGAQVRIVAPQVTEAIRRLTDENSVIWYARQFEPGDLDGVALAIALDDDDAVNAEVYREATARGVLCNVVDQPDRCHFYYPAVVRRGQLQIAISTGGVSPALASQIRRDLEEQFDSAYSEWVDALGDARERVMRESPRSPRRTRLLQRIASKQAYRSFTAKRRQRKELA